MRPWGAADGTPLKKEESDLMVAGAFKELVGKEAGSNTIYVGGDQLILGVVEPSGDVVIYQTKIERVTTNVDDLLLEAIPTGPGPTEPA